MAYSELHITPHVGSNRVNVTAYGGTRRQRGAALASWRRNHPGVTLVRITYSETYGFQSATYATYDLKGE